MIRWLETEKYLTVPWAEVERTLGRPYAYTPEDDDVVFRALALATGYPWLGTTPGMVTRNGWTLEKRRL